LEARQDTRLNDVGSRGKEQLKMFNWKRVLLILAGWLAVILGFLGIFLPVLPTTPFLLLAASCFAKSSERFHSWLLNSPLFGPIIRDWQEKRCIAPKVKCWSMVLVVVTFSISLTVVPLVGVRLFLCMMLVICLVTISRIPVKPIARYAE